MFLPGASITGAAVTGFTAPTYSLTADTGPNMSSKQFAVSGLGGTQTGVDTNTVSKPFTVTMFKPAVLRPIPAANPTTGVIRAIPNNVYKLLTRKGVVPASNQVPLVLKITTTIEVPAGSDTYEPEDVKAAISAHFGCGYQNAAGIADTCLTGIL